MVEPANRELAEAYWSERGGRAWGAVDDAMRAGGSEAVGLIAALAGSAPDDDALGFLGAGPLEDLVNWHGLELVDEIDRELDAEPKLRIALAFVRVGTETLTSDTRLRSFYNPQRDAQGRLE